MTAVYTARLVEWDGANWDEVATIPGATFTQPLDEALNGMGTTAIAVSPNEPDHATFYAELAVNAPAREVQILRDGGSDPVWWGTPYEPARRLGAHELSVPLAESIPWWLQGLHFGKAQRENLLVDPNFDSGAFAPNWTTVGVDTATVESTGFLRSRSARLTHSASDDVSLQQTVSFTAGGIGNNLSVAAWYMVESAGFVAGPFEQRGLYAEWRYGGTTFGGSASAPLNVDSKDVWQRVEIPLGQLWVPPNETVTINVRGYALEGNVRWGAFFLGLMESFSWTTYASPGDTGADFADLLAGMVAHSQDAAYDKVGLGIGSAGAATGGVYAFTRQFAEHANIWTNGVMDLVQREEGIDIGYDLTLNSRALRSYSRVGGGLGKGADRTALDLSLGGPYVVDYGWSRPFGQGASSVVQLGAGDGPDREEAGYITPGAMGGRVREMVVSASADATVDDLDERAAKQAAMRANPRRLTLVLAAGALIQGATTLTTGDRVTVPAYDPFVDAGVYRVMQRAINPHADNMTVNVEAVV